MQSIRTKKEENNEAKKVQGISGAAKKSSKISWVRTCIAKERKGYDSPFQLLVFILFTLP